MNEPSGAVTPPERGVGGPASPSDGPAPDGLTFTEYVRGLEPGVGPAPEVFRRLSQRLRGVLVLQLKRRSLWHLRPRCLGIFGPASWQEPGAVEELVVDCYRFVFLDRLASLRAHLRIKANIDGLVFRSINNYLYDMQKKHDPLGFRVFGILQLAVRHCCDTGTLQVLAGDKRVRNDTVLGFHDGAQPQALPPQELRPRIATWNDDLLPELVTARGKKLDRLVIRLAEHVAKLHDLGAFTFADLLEPLKEDARQRWNAIWSHAEGRPAGDSEGVPVSFARHAPPVPDCEQRLAFEGLTRCVSLQLEHLTAPPKTRERLRRLWVFLRHQVAESAGSKTPSRRRIARRLEIPRDSLPGLYEILGRLVQGCHGAEGSPHASPVGNGS